MSKFTRLFNIENAFVIIALLSGLFFAVLVPPNEVPDEGAHFARVYADLHGDLSSQKVNMPVSLISMLGNYYDISHIGGYFNWDNYLKSFSEQADLQKMGQFLQAAPYSPVLYLPQLIGLGLGLAFRMTPQGFFVLGRIFSLLAYVAAGYLILKKTPTPKLSLFVLFLTPTALNLAASYSADAVQNVLSFIYIFMVLAGIFSRNKITKKDWLIFIIASTLLSLTKPVSLLLIFLAFMLPASRFKDLKNKLVFIGSQLAISIVLIAAWERIVIKSQLVGPGTDTNVSLLRQLVYIILNPISFINTILATSSQNSYAFFVQFVGNFGWLTAPMPEFVYFLFGIALLLAILVDLRKGFSLTRAQKGVLLGVTALYYLGLLTSMYLFWSPVGDKLVSGVQGRYFIPIFPLVIVLILSIKSFPGIPFEKILSGAVFLLMPVILLFSLQTVYLKFYTPCAKSYYSLDTICTHQNGALSYDETADKTVGPIDRPFSQDFVAKCSNLNSLSILLLPGAGEKNGYINVQLIDTQTKKILFQADTFATRLDKTRWKVFTFPPLSNSWNRQYTLVAAPEKGVIDSTSLGATTHEFTPFQLSGVDFPANLTFFYECPDGLLFNLHLLGR